MRLTYTTNEEGQTEPESGSPHHPAMHGRQDQEQYRERDGSRKTGHILPKIDFSDILLEDRHNASGSCSKTEAGEYVFWVKGTNVECIHDAFNAHYRG
jgi:hypothetical protein